MSLPVQWGVLLLNTSLCKHTKYLIQLLFEMVFTPQGVAGIGDLSLQIYVMERELEIILTYYSAAV